jgi:hypothetical protein
MTQTTVCSRRTGTPSVLARSALSAPPRMAMPMVLLRRNSARPTKHAATPNIATTSLPVKMIGSTVNSTCHGIENASPPSSNSSTRRNAAPLRSWAIPIVATVRTRRGERKNRRTSRVSTTTPSTIAARRPAANARKYPSATVLVTRRTDRVAGSAPSSPAAKLTMRLAR